MSDAEVPEPVPSVRVTSSPRVGSLAIVGTPIGNLGDISERGRRALHEADVIICEDSRRSGRLLQQLGLPKRPFLVANEHNEASTAAQVVGRMQRGERFALITDAGMPAVSDPGQRLITAVVQSGGSIEVVPGPTAAVSALVLSGLATSRFVFEGFLARKGKDRVAQLNEMSEQPRTTVFYESPKRIRATLRDLIEVCGPDRLVALARELTKLHEQVVRGTLSEVSDHFADVEPRGEFVIVLSGRAPAAPATDDELLHALRAALAGGASTRDAVASVVASSGASKNRVYGLATDVE